MIKRLHCGRRALPPAAAYLRLVRRMQRLPKPRLEIPHREAQTSNMSTKQIVQYRTMTMKRFSHALLLALLCSSVSLATATAASTGAQAVDEAWRKAISANDLNAIMTLYSKDAVMRLPDAPEAKGPEAIRKSYADLLAANTVTAATLADTHYQISGDLSVGWGDFTLVLAPNAGG